MPEIATLELSLDRIGGDAYATAARLQMSNSLVVTDLLGDDPVRIDIPEGPLLEAATDLEYGTLLGQYLFSERAIHNAFSIALGAARARNRPLRIQLHLAGSAQDLHALHWEKLVLPDETEHLFGQAQFPFSRFIESADIREVHLRRKDEFRALFVASNPIDIEQAYGLSPLDTNAEFARTRENLSPIPVESLGAGVRATPEALEDRLKERFDILYLLCHGTIGKSGPALLLEHANGPTNLVHADEIARILRNAEHPPRLVVLSSCQSAGSGRTAAKNREALTAIGPLIARDGIPAVIAMQGDIQASAATTFVATFFRQLAEYGLLDRAVGIAREQLRRNRSSDWWKPILFTRLQTAMIQWYEPGFADRNQAGLRWGSLIRSITAQKCTPILGIGFQETIIGPRRALARRWATEAPPFPLTPRDAENFAHVANYVAIRDRESTVRLKLEEEIRSQVEQRFGGWLGGMPADATPYDLLRRAGAIMRQRNPEDPHLVFAGLNAPVFITADQTDLLYDALVELGKQPRKEYCRWRDVLAGRKLLKQVDRTYKPSRDKPLIYHLFGHVEEPGSQVLTEDEFMEYLMGVGRYRDKIPSEVLLALTTRNLLIVGFHLEDWSFRALFRLIMAFEGREMVTENTNIAAQVDLEAERVSDPAAAHEFLERAVRDAALSIYWGEVTDFVSELKQKLDNPASNAA